MICLAMDVHYYNDENDFSKKLDKACVGGVLFELDEEKFNNKQITPIAEFKTLLDVNAEYQSGEFYKLELPCLLKMIYEYNLHPDTIIVDGLCTLPCGKSGLGDHLFKSLSNWYEPEDYKQLNIVGIAKNKFEKIYASNLLYRGESAKPLFVNVSSYYNESYLLSKWKVDLRELPGGRIPTIIKRADTLSRQH